MAIGRVDEGMALIDETIGGVEENGELYFLPEAMRVKGCAILASPELPSRRSGNLLHPIT